MIRILITDDEAIHRKGLSNQILENYPEVVVSEAQNGLEALRILGKEPIDIIITDVKMPVMDGLALLENIQDLSIKVKPVILSAFGDFEYAKLAVKYNAVDYILKPIDQQQLRDVIGKLIFRVKEERRIAAIAREAEAQLRLSLPFYIDSIFTKFIQNNSNEHETIQIMDMVDSQKNCIVLLIEIDDFENKSYQLMKRNIDFRHEIKNELRNVSKAIGRGSGITFYDQQQTGLVYHLIFLKDQAFPDKNKLQVQLLKSFRKFEQSVDITWYCAIYHKVIDFSAYNKKTTEILKRTLLMSFYSDKKIIFTKATTLFSDNPHNSKMNEAVCLKKMIISNNSKQIMVTFNNLIKELLLDGYIDPYILKDIVHKILMEIVSEINFGSDNTTQKNDERVLRSIIDKSSKLVTLKGEVTNWLIGFSVDRMKKLHRSNENMIEEILAFISENYADDISLQELTQMVHLTSPYLSVVFKEKTGINFSKYILSIRLDKAKKKLISTNEKIYKIAESVGYSDSKYFNRVFKAELGVTPKEYRKLCSKMGEDNGRY